MAQFHHTFVDPQRVKEGTIETEFLTDDLKPLVRHSKASFVPSKGKNVTGVPVNP